VALFEETPGRAVIETADPDGVEEAFAGVAPVTRLGTATDDGTLSLDVGGTELTVGAERVAELRGVLGDALD